MFPLEIFDDALRSHHGASVIVGVDEAGRGPLAGPVVAAAVALGRGAHSDLRDLRDSKTLTAAARDRLFVAVRRHALAVGVGWSLPAEIDREGILAATLLAMGRAVERLPSLGSLASMDRPARNSAAKRQPPQGVLVAIDGRNTVPGLASQQRALVKGDRYSLAIAGASVIAKVVRDRWMRVLDRDYPGYGFAVHKGYGTPRHLAALGRLGPSQVHRRSFEPVRQAPLPLAVQR